MWQPHLSPVNQRAGERNHLDRGCSSKGSLRQATPSISLRAVRLSNGAPALLALCRHCGLSWAVMKWPPSDEQVTKVEKQNELLDQELVVCFTDKQSLSVPPFFSWALMTGL